MVASFDIASAHRVRRAGGWIGVVAIGIGVLVLAYHGLTRGLGNTDTDPGLAFRSVPVSRGDLRETVVATGRMEPRSRVLARSEVSGLIRAVHVEEGDRVTQGQPMFELDRERLEDRVNALRAALETKRAAARYDVVGRASLEVEQSRREHARVKSLFERGVTSQREFDDSLYALRLAEVALNDARAEADARRASVLESEHLLRQAEKDLERSVIRAPIDGLVVERHVDVGAVVADVTANGGTLLAVVADDVRIRLVAEVDENEIAPVRVGQLADVTVDAFPGETITGIVRKVSSSGTVDRDVSNFEVEIELPEDERMRVGMSADARVRVREHGDAVLVPNGAIVRGGEHPRVRVRDPSADAGFRLVPIREAYSDGFHTVVTEGIEAGETVLIPTDAKG